MFSVDFISGSRDFAHFTSGALILMHSADASILNQAVVTEPQYYRSSLSKKMVTKQTCGPLSHLITKKQE